MSRPLRLFAALLAVTAAALWATRTRELPQLPHAVPPAEEAAPPAGPPAVGELAPRAQGEAPAPPPDTPGAVTTFPDGSTRPALNGVTTDLTIEWPTNRPYAPVVEVVTNNDGVAFYKHADGTFTTTLVRVETISGRTVQFAQTYTPGPTPAGTQLRR